METRLTKLVDNLQKEIDDLIKINKDHQILNGKLREENKQLNELLNKDNTGALILTLNKEKELQEIIYKAIGYMEQPSYKGYLLASMGTHYFKLLEILKGDSNG